jgi:hypothetical protein
MDTNIIFVALIIIFLIFIIQKFTRIVIISVLIYIGYVIFKSKFINPRALILYFTNKITEIFNIFNTKDNDSNNGNNGNNSNYDLECSNENENNTIQNTIQNAIQNAIQNKKNNTHTHTNTNTNTIVLKCDVYYLDKKHKINGVSIDEIILQIPVLLDYKLYFEKVIRFTLNFKTDVHDLIQKDFIAKTMRDKMSVIFHYAYNTFTNTKYPIQNYNELLIAENEFNDTLYTFVFLDLNENDNNNLNNLKKKFVELNNNLKQFIINKVNDIKPTDYNITTSILPQIYEPQSANIFNDL